MMVGAATTAKHPRILILSVSAGAGHVRAAEALRVQAELEGTAHALHLDVMDFVGATFRKLYTDFYIKLVNKAPALWGYLYQLTHEAEADGSMQRLRRGIERLNTRSLLRAISAFRPDAIVCTHFLPAELLSLAQLKGGPACPIWVQVTDFDLHRMWVQEGVAGYFAPNDEVAYRMRAQGIAPERIHITGIPIMPAFAAAPKRGECAAELGLDPSRKTLLLMGGGAGLGSLDLIGERLLELDEDVQLIVMAGRNAEMLAALQTLAARHPARLRPQGFTDRVERLMACSDLVVTKPGGLSTSECLAMGLPMILNAPIPGQEERNADYLLEQGVALKACDGVTLEYRVQLLLSQPQMLSTMRTRALALGRPRAAADVLTHVRAAL